MRYDVIQRLLYDAIPCFVCGRDEKCFPEKYARSVRGGTSLPAGVRQLIRSVGERALTRLLLMISAIQYPSIWIMRRVRYAVCVVQLRVVGGASPRAVESGPCFLNSIFPPPPVSSRADGQNEVLRSAIVQMYCNNANTRAKTLRRRRDGTENGRDVNSCTFTYILALRAWA